MVSFFIRLVEKIQLTHDVYELVYESEEIASPLPWQFLLCDTDSTNPKLRRSYSINDYKSGKIHFIIKKLPDGKGGSTAICEQALWHSMQVWWPMGHFVLPTSLNEKLFFIGTGTGFAPLYFQAKQLLENNPNTPIVFLFGVRTEWDLFYVDIFQEWAKKYSQFSYQFCISQPTWEILSYFHGRVTDYLRENLAHAENTNTLYSICGSPAMVTEAREILTTQGITKEYILFEQY